MPSEISVGIRKEQKNITSWLCQPSSIMEETIVNPTPNDQIQSEGDCPKILEIKMKLCVLKLSL